MEASFYKTIQQIENIEDKDAQEQILQYFDHEHKKLLAIHHRQQMKLYKRFTMLAQETEAFMKWMAANQNQIDLTK